jgi:hypothetical protein
VVIDQPAEETMADESASRLEVIRELRALLEVE